jgi:hypothetical protein
MKRLNFLAAVLAVLALSSSGVAQQPQEGNKTEERYSAIASNVSELARAGVVPLDIWITRYTDDAEEEKLMAALDQKGQEGLVEALRRMPTVARMRVPGELSTEFHYARQSRGRDGRRRIILATDRPIGFVEATNRTYTLEYPFTMLELRVDDSGMGDGQLFLAAKFIRTGNLLVLENLVSQAVVLSNVKRSK